MERDTLTRNERINEDLENGLSPMLKSEYELAVASLNKYINKHKDILAEYRLAMTESSETYHDNAPAESAMLSAKSLEGQIDTLSKKLENSSLYEDDFNSEVVTLGSEVEILYEGDEESEKFILMGANLNTENINNVITISSPIGRAIIGKSTGEIVEFAIDNRPIRVKLVSIK